MNVSDWVKFTEKKEYRGYIIYISTMKTTKNISVRLTSPLALLNKVIMANESDLIIDEFYITDEEISTLIDLSLMLNDKEWFKELILLKH